MQMISSVRILWVLFLLFAGFTQAKNRRARNTTPNYSQGGNGLSQNQVKNVAKFVNSPKAQNQAEGVGGRQRVGKDLYLEKFTNPYPSTHKNGDVNMYSLYSGPKSTDPLVNVKGEQAARSTGALHNNVQMNRQVENPTSRYNNGGYYKGHGQSNLNLEGSNANGRYNIHLGYDQNNAAPIPSKDDVLFKGPKGTNSIVRQNANGVPSDSGSSIQIYFDEDEESDFESLDENYYDDDMDGETDFDFDEDLDLD